MIEVGKILFNCPFFRYALEIYIVLLKLPDFVSLVFTILSTFNVFALQNVALGKPSTTHLFQFCHILNVSNHFHIYISSHPELKAA